MLAAKNPIVIIGGFMSAARDYRSWQARFQAAPYNRRVFVADIKRFDWVSSPDSSFRPQLLAVRTIVQQALRASGADKVTLICHSAGGRIGRLWLGDKGYAGTIWDGRRFVQRIIFLGSPYINNEPWSRRSTGFANANYPGAFYPEIEYISVVGKAVFARANGNVEERLAFQNYRTQLPQNPLQWGDGIVPLEGANVPGATNLVLDGIYHASILGRPGYETTSALKQWGKFLLD